MKTMHLTLTLVAATLALASGGVKAGADDAHAQDLLKKGGCIACHAVDKKKVGPSYQDISLKHKGENAGPAVEKTVRTGSKGAYGAVPMPPISQAKLTDGELHEVVEWVLSK